jgi:alkylation response protein AidB-like acyl-CoA dehydrogenase
MRFSFSDDQLALRDAVRELLAKHCTPADVRAAWSTAPGALDRGVWDELASMGALHVLVPEARGGIGLDFVSLVLVLEEAGRVALPHSIVETAAVVAPLHDAGNEMVTACFGGALVPVAADADAIVVDHDGAIRLYQPAECAFESVDGVDRGRRLGRLTRLANDGVVLTDEPREIEEAFDRGVVGTSAVLIGLAQTMLDMTVEYVRERQQFGVAVGSFQAVKHTLADALRDLSFARPAVYRAAWAVAHETGTAKASAHISMAKAMAADAATTVGRAALQCHGAIGYTVEHDLHLYLKRTWALARAWGDPAWHRARVAEAIGA